MTTADLPLNSDYDYVMSLILLAEQGESYEVEVLEGTVSKNGYTVPNLRISWSEQPQQCESNFPVRSLPFMEM